MTFCMQGHLHLRSNLLGPRPLCKAQHDGTKSAREVRQTATVYNSNSNHRGIRLRKTIVQTSHVFKLPARSFNQGNTLCYGEYAAKVDITASRFA